MTTAETAYTGETKPRKKWVAVALTFLCPGLGYMYVGQFIKGLTVNLLFLLLLEGFIIALSVLKFFPLLPFLVLAGGWLVFTGLIASEVAARAEEAGDGYVLQGYNHWTIYLVAFLLSYLVPIALTANFTTNNLWRLERVDNAAMYPTIEPGDTVLVDLTAFRTDAPERGEVVATGAGASANSAADRDSPLEFLRIVGVHNDVVRMEGNTLYVNDDAVGHSPLDEAQVAESELDGETGLLAWVEHNQGERYVISVSPRVYTELTMEPARLESDEYFLLADNRSQVPVDGREADIRDSRNFGEVAGSNLVGVPRYIFWSTDPDGSVQWERIGLQVR
ncbi:MAG: signal peptidase I [Persicimonas sp.]